MFVVYNTTNTVQVGPLPGGKPHSLYAKTYKTLAGAKKACSRFNSFEPKQYAYTTEEDYRTNVVHTVTRTNYLSGKPYQEASNTLSFCSPSSEAYWSM